jgi:hypothetical protein
VVICLVLILTWFFRGVVVLFGTGFNFRIIILPGLVFFLFSGLPISLFRRPTPLTVRMQLCILRCVLTVNGRIMKESVSGDIMQYLEIRWLSNFKVQQRSLSLWRDKHFPY